MNSTELQTKLNQLISNWEDETVEFKQAGDGFSTHDIGKYFSALSNEANLRELSTGWLVFGVNNSTRSIVGTDYREDSERLQSTKMQISEDTDPSITFRNIHELSTTDGRVILFEVPPAPKGIPIAWKGHYYARAGESLTSLGLDKLDEIRQQSIASDWSAQIVSEATMDHLNEEALQKARKSFAQKHANRWSIDEIDQWSDSVFLDRANLTQDGNITRTTLLLLGKTESAYLLSPHPAQLTWKLEGQEQAYEHLGPPFFLNTSALYKKIRNIQIRILPEDTLLTEEISKYDQKVVLEALHNCIAHQDYLRNGRIVVTEQPDKLVFENEGNFFEGMPDDYIYGEKTPRRYRNPFLAQAMVELNMIDTMGYGIHEMNKKQASRYFPLPDYEFDNEHTVRITIYGNIVDQAYTRLLLQKANLPLVDVWALDRIQKKQLIPDDMIRHLRKEKLIEGRKPNLHVSAVVAKTTGDKAKYIRTKAQDDDYYGKLITDYLKKFGKASRKEINELLLSKLSDGLNDVQKMTQINNLLTKLRRSGVIENRGSRTASEWVLVNK